MIPENWPRKIQINFSSCSLAMKEYQDLSASR